MGTVVRNGMLAFDKDQEVADEALEDPDVMVTARILTEVMNGLVEGLVFTTETRADFPNNWGIPTLDTMWKTVEGGGGERRKVG